MRLTFLQMVEGDELPWTREMGCQSFTSTSVRLQTFRLLASRLSTRIQPVVTQHYAETVGKIGNVCLYKWHFLVAGRNNFLA